MRIAVIGHGASLEGAGLGSEIDGCDIVMRLHDWDWQTVADHGARYDIGVLPGPWMQKAVTQIARWPESGWLAYSWDGKAKGAAPPRTIIVNIGQWRARLIERGAVCTRGIPALTRGLSALIMASRRFPGSEIFAFGFDNVFSGENENYNYPAACGSVADTKLRHDMRVERALIPEIEKHYRTRIIPHA
jgi:hypothetical protein